MNSSSPPSPPGLAELEQIILKEVDIGRGWMGWSIAFVALVGSATFVAHGCCVQCFDNYLVLRTWLSGPNSVAATGGAGGLPAVPPQAMLCTTRCHCRPPTHTPVPTHRYRAVHTPMLHPASTGPTNSPHPRPLPEPLLTPAPRTSYSSASSVLPHSTAATASIKTVAVEARHCRAPT